MNPPDHSDQKPPLNLHYAQRAGWFSPNRPRQIASGADRPAAAPPDRPDVVIFPPLLPLGGLALGFILEHYFPLAGGAGQAAAPARHLLAALLTMAGVALMAGSRLALVRAGTNVSPRRPTLHLVQRWPFTWSRNPMYLGGNLALLGLALAFVLPWVGVLFPFLIAVCHYGVVRREEQYLARKFGPAYHDYRRRVPRWL